MHMNTSLGIVFISAYGTLFVPFVTHDLRLGLKTYASCEALRKPPMLIMAYRTLQILQLKTTLVIGRLLIPTQTIALKLAVFSTFMIVKNGHRMRGTTVAMMIGWVVASVLIWSLVLLMGGYLHEYGIRGLKSWKYHQWESREERQVMSKFRKSCTPITLNFGKTYVIRRLTVFKFIRQITRGVFRTLMAMH
ncbi:unnamed protein product [Orchesella dallaii]|uniref:Uncharacterized protein n=1 Tax=Orchesella dallaii TaxID=48710 RepID=A0ABP1RG23_9HEXA